jgi:hypothetical protein
MSQDLVRAKLTSVVTHVRPHSLAAQGFTLVSSKLKVNFTLN